MLNTGILHFFLLNFSIFHTMLALCQDIPSIMEFIVSVIRVLIFAFLLEIRHIWIIIHSFVEIVDFFVGQNSLRILQQFVIKI